MLSAGDAPGRSARGGAIILSMLVHSNRAAWYEAGHRAAAIIYNIPIVRVCIDTATPHLHRAHYRPPPVDDTILAVILNPPE
jgi:hypothetical protein